MRCRCRGVPPLRSDLQDDHHEVPAGRPTPLAAPSCLLFRLLLALTRWRLPHCTACHCARRHGRFSPFSPLPRLVSPFRPPLPGSTPPCAWFRLSGDTRALPSCNVVSILFFTSVPLFLAPLRTSARPPSTKQPRPPQLLAPTAPRPPGPHHPWPAPPPRPPRRSRPRPPRARRPSCSSRSRAGCEVPADRAPRRRRPCGPKYSGRDEGSQSILPPSLKFFSVAAKEHSCILRYFVFTVGRQSDGFLAHR